MAKSAFEYLFMAEAMMPNQITFRDWLNRRRRLVLFLVIALFVVSFAAWRTWRSFYPIFVVEAQLVRIGMRPPEPGAEVDYDPVKTIALLRSPLILERAINERKLKKLKTLENAADPTATIASMIELTVPYDSVDGTPNGIVYFKCRGPIADDCETILTAVVESYQDFVYEQNKNRVPLRILRLTGPRSEH